MSLDDNQFLKEQMTKKIYIIYILIFTFIAYLGALDGLIQLLKGSLLWILLILGVSALFIIATECIGNIKFENRWAVWIIIGIGLRIAYYCLVQTMQTSDFYWPTAFYLHLDEIGGYNEYTTIYKELDDFQVYYSLYPAWSTYMFIVHGLYEIFGVHTSLLVGVNIILSGFMICIYARLLNEVGIDTKTKNIVIALLACFPQMVMWDAVASPDHFAVLFIALLVYIWYKSLKYEKILLYVLAEAVCISIIGLFKPIVPLMIVLLICADIFMALFINNGTIKMLVVKSLLVVILTVGVSGTVSCCNRILLENYIKTDVQQATSFYFLWGYSVDENGNWDSYAADPYINEAFEQAEYVADVVTYANDAASHILKRNITLLPRILRQKFKLLFYSDDWPAFWSLTNDNNECSKWLYENIDILGRILTVSNSFFLFLMPFALKKKNEASIFLSLGWVGYICFLVLAGIQTRYRYIMLPFQLVLTGMGYVELKGLFYEKYKH